MHVKRVWAVAAVLSILVFGFHGCSSVSRGPAPYASYTNVYLQNNIHGFTRVSRGNTEHLASYANYVEPDTGHFFIPVNTAVAVGKWRGGFSLTRQDTGQMIYFEYRPANMGGLSVEQYLDLITSPQKTPLDGLNATDLKGIKEGRVMKGMSKKGVRMAWGYPARHRTPSLDDDVWTYWRNRWVMKTVSFSNGKVAAVN